MHFGGQDHSLVALVTHLILKSTTGPKVLELLMQGCKSWTGTAKQKARILLGMSLVEFHRSGCKCAMSDDFIGIFIIFRSLHVRIILLIVRDRCWR